MFMQGFEIGLEIKRVNKVSENIKSKDSYDSNLDESDLLVTPLFDANKNECFDSRGNVVKINEFEDGYYDSEGDILYFESLLNDDLVYRDPSIPVMSVASILKGFTDELPLEENDDLFSLESKKDEWKKILYDAQINDLMSKDKVFDLKIHDQFCFSNIISSGEIKVHIEVLLVSSSIRLPILDGSLPLSRYQIFNKWTKSKEKRQNQARECNENEKPKPKAYTSLMGQPSPPAQEPIFVATTTTTTTLLLPPPPPQQSTIDPELATRVSAVEKICANFKKKDKLQDKTTQALSSKVYMM
nr:hypothetical protein [Tanacetum cinerariifolium]